MILSSHSAPPVRTRHGRWMQRAYEQGLVSVIIPTYNRAGLLRETLASIQNQHYRPVEVLVVDHGSTDQTQEVIQDASRASDSRLRIRNLRQKHTGNISAGRNLGSIQSRGEYLQYLDSDDLLHPQKFAHEVPLLTNQDRLDFVWSDTARFQGDDPERGVCITSPDCRDLLPRYILMPIWHTCGPLYRRTTCVDLGPWNESLAVAEDWEYGVRLASSKPQRQYIPKILSFYRMHGSGQTRDHYKTWRVVKPDYDAFRAAEKMLRAKGRLREPGVRAALATRYLEIAWRAGELGRDDTSQAVWRKAHDLAAAGPSQWRVTAFESLWTLLGLRPASLIFRKLHNAHYKAWIAWRQYTYS